MRDPMENIVAQRDQLRPLLRMTIEIAEPGYSRVTMPLWDGIRNGMGVAHGGAIFSLADIAFGAAANAGSDARVVSLSTNIDFLRPGRVGPLTAEAQEVRRGNRVVNYDVRVFDGEGALIARTTAAGFVMPSAGENPDGKPESPLSENDQGGQPQKDEKSGPVGDGGEKNA